MHLKIQTDSILMVNAPMPVQLTVGKLRRILENVPDNTVISLQVPHGGIGHSELETFYNLKTHYAGGPVLRFQPLLDNRGDTQGSSLAEPG
jgi:hypothetical protein